MEYKIKLLEEFANIYEEAAKHADMSVEDMLQQALMNYICICAEK
jgi:predicted HTH domain antitoxin